MAQMLLRTAHKNIFIPVVLLYIIRSGLSSGWGSFCLVVYEYLGLPDVSDVTLLCKVARG
jgi:hypothetical protein